MPRQLSVFLENRSGRLRELAALLKDADIDILSFNLADTSDYGMLRLIIDQPERGLTALREGGFSAQLTEVMVVLIPARPGTLSDLLEALGSDFNIKYMYPYQTSGTDAGMVLKVDDMAEAARRIAAAGFAVHID